MSASSGYFELRHPTLSVLDVVVCYLCERPLGEKSTIDHIIPKSLFTAESPSPPKLPVHFTCNNSKSTDDEFYGHFIRLMASTDARASAELGKIINKADREKKYANLIGVGRRVRNYKLALTVFLPLIQGLDVQSGNNVYTQFKIPPEHQDRLNNYVSDMCRGLFMRNVKGAVPNKPKLVWHDFAMSGLRGNLGFGTIIDGLVAAASSTVFGQEWGDRIRYSGSRVVESGNKGYVYIEFFGKVGILAQFTD